MLSRCGWPRAVLFGLGVLFFVHGAAIAGPANDLCADATTVCTGQISDPDLGTCEGGQPPPNDPPLHEVCSISRQDCKLSATCVARTPGTDAYRCLVSNVDNSLAETDGPDTLNTACINSGFNRFQRDVWYEYIAPCSGRMTISNCGLPSFDSMMAVYTNGTNTCSCPPNNTQDIACDDDFCVRSSALAAHIVAGNCYLIREGGFSVGGTAADAAFGITELDIGVICDPAAAVNPPQVVTTPPQLACRKNRYISFQTNNPGTSVAFEIRRTSAPPMVGWAGLPDVNDVSGVYAAPQFSSTWPVVLHVGDCEIIPVANYEVRATQDGSAFSPALALQTIAQPSPKFFGDTTGGLVAGAWDCPNGVVNANDFQMVLQKFLGAATAPHLTLANVQAVSSNDPCLNVQVNIADVFLILKAFQGIAYPFIAGTTANCPPNTGAVGQCPL